MRRLTKNSLTVGAFLATTALTTPAFAQDAMSDKVPHARQQLDENGVNWATGEVVGYTIELSIGAAGRDGLQYSLAHGNAVSGSNWTLDLRGSVGASFTAIVGVRAINFNYVNGTYVPDDGSGATLVVNSSSQYTLTLEDGTAIVFTNFPQDNETARGTSVTYPTGETITLAYNSISWCTTLLDTCNTYAYATRLQSVTSSVGYQLHYTYGKDAINAPSDSNGWKKLNSITAFNTTVESCAPTAGTCTFTNSWPVVKFTTTGGVTDPVGNTTTYSTSTTQFTIQRPSETSPGFVANLDSNARVTSITHDGLTWNYSFTPGTSTMSATRTDPLGHTKTVVSSTSAGLPTSITDENGHVTTYAYNSSNQLTKVTLPEGNYTQYAYDGRGNLITTTKVAKAGSGLANVITSAAYPSSCTSTASCNEPTSTTDANGNVTNYTYDSAGELLTTTSPAPTTRAVQPEARYTYASIATPGGSVSELKSVSQCQTTASCAGTADETKTTYNYSNQLLPTSATKANGTGTLSATTTNTYDNIGNLLTVQGPLGTAETSRYRYDLDRRLIGATSPSPGNGQPDRAIRITYNADGDVSKEEAGTVTDQTDTAWTNFTSLQETDIGYDSNARPNTELLQSGGVTNAFLHRDYDALGRVDCTAVRMNPATYNSLPGACTPATQGSYGPDQISKTIYDAAGEVTQVQVGVGTAAAASERTIAYNPNGTVASLTDANGNVTSYQHDGFDRPIRTTYPGGSTEQTTAYDNNGNALTLVNRAGQTFSLAYDALNRVTSKSGAVPTVNYSYDNLNRMLKATFASNGLGITNTYDALSRLTSTSSNMDGTARAISYQYDLAGNRTQITHPDAANFTYGYDPLGRLTGLYEGAGTSFALDTFSYGNNGLVSSRTEAGGSSVTYGYDSVGRLTSRADAFTGGTNNVNWTLGYNPASQITSRTRDNDSYAWNGAVNVNRSYSVNSLNQYTAAGSASFVYDTNGNLTSDGSNSYVYDPENKLTSVSGGHTATLSYDPLGRLWQISTPSATTRFLYDGDQLALEYDGSGNILNRYVQGVGADDPLVWYVGAQVGSAYRRNLHADYLGSIVATSNGSGANASINTYDEYGIPGSSNSGRFQYTGQMWVSELGMYFYKARAYSPTLGRFMQTDPIGYEDGPNWYAYVHNDPVNGTDPLGLEPGCDQSPGALLVCGQRPPAQEPPADPQPASNATRDMQQTGGISGGDPNAIVVIGRRLVHLLPIHFNLATLAQPICTVASAAASQVMSLLPSFINTASLTAAGSGTLWKKLSG